MNGNQKANIDELITKSLLKVNSITKRIEKISLLKFPSENPIKVLNFFKNVCEELRGSLLKLRNDKDQSSEREAKIITLFLCEMASHLRFIEGANVEKTPFGTVRSFEKFSLGLFPKILLIIRPQWSYNYSIISGFSHFYESKFRGIRDKKQENIFQAFEELHVLSFPNFERNNILLHANFGHEFGHYYSKKFIDEEKKDFLISIATEIEKLKKEDIEEAIWISKKQKRIEEVCKIRQRGLEEIIADLAGVHIFGLASLFALDEVAQISQSYNNVSVPDYYPPWRFRIREILKYLKEKDLQKILDTLKTKYVDVEYEKIIISLKNKIDYFSVLTEEKPDIEKIDENESFKIAYNSISDALPNVKSFLSNHFATTQSSPFDDMGLILPLCQRLKLNITPNAIEDDVFNPIAVDIRKIINAGWLYKLTYLSTLGDKDPKDYFKEMEITNNLISKGIELADIHEDYKKWEADGKKA